MSKPHNFKDLTNKQFNRLKVTKLHLTKNKRSYWLDMLRETFIRRILNYEWSINKAISTPVRPIKKKS